VKEWREKKRASSGITGLPMIQDKIPLAQPLQRLILLLPGGKGERIQDKIVLRRQSPCTFAAYG